MVAAGARDGHGSFLLGGGLLATGVAEIRAEIAAGEVYQVNLCRLLSAPLDPSGGGHHDVAALAAIVAHGNPAPWSDVLTKDHVENIMIVDLVRNDLGRVARPGGVTAPSLCAVEAEEWRETGCRALSVPLLGRCHAGVTGYGT